MSQPRAYNLYAKLATGQTEYCGTIFAPTLAGAQQKLREELEQNLSELGTICNLGMVAPGKTTATILVSELLSYQLIDATAEADAAQLHRKLAAVLTTGD